MDKNKIDGSLDNFTPSQATMNYVWNRFRGLYLREYESALPDIINVREYRNKIIPLINKYKETGLINDIQIRLIGNHKKEKLSKEVSKLMRNFNKED